MSTFPDSHRDLLDAQIASFATVGADGFPQVTLVWFLYDEVEDKLKISLNDTRLKLKNLRREPKCSLLILDLEKPYRYLEVRGTARLDPDDDYAFADRIGAKYNADVRDFDQPGTSRFAVTIDTANVYAVDLSG